MIISYWNSNFSSKNRVLLNIFFDEMNHQKVEEKYSYKVSVEKQKCNYGRKIFIWDWYVKVTFAVSESSRVECYMKKMPVTKWGWAEKDNYPAQDDKIRGIKLYFCEKSFNKIIKKCKIIAKAIIMSFTSFLFLKLAMGACWRHKLSLLLERIVFTVLLKDELNSWKASYS